MDRNLCECKAKSNRNLNQYSTLDDFPMSLMKSKRLLCIAALHLSTCDHNKVCDPIGAECSQTGICECGVYKTYDLDTHTCKGTIKHAFAHFLNVDRHFFHVLINYNIPDIKKPLIFLSNYCTHHLWNMCVLTDIAFCSRYP